MYTVSFSGGSRPSDKGAGGHGYPDPEIRGGEVSKKFFWALWASVWSKNKVGGGGTGPPGPSRGSATEYSSS